MNTEKKPRQKTSSVNGVDKAKPDQVFYQKNLFLSMALDMSWQLAIAVLVPLIGGFELDHHYKTTPLWTIIGSTVALIGFILILINVTKEAGRRVGDK
jgi:F0F1-type ATP synthase assembly protein I